MNNHSLFARLGLIASAVAALAAPMASHANSVYTVLATGTITNTASLDFTIVVERFLALRIGTGAITTNTATIDQVAFAVPGTTNGIGGVGIAGASTIAAHVRGNGGVVTLTSTTPAGNLVNAAANTINYTTITAAGVALPTPAATVLAHPAFVSGGTSAAVTPTSTLGVVDAGAIWTFTYSNAVIVAGGTYGGVNALGSRVVYTAVMP